jgi:hypothetical protein
MEPMWTREVKLYHRRLDPLGLSRVSQWTTDQLLPGITSVTDVARNYSFYCWAIGNLLKENKVTQRSQFASQITKREAAFVIASIFHEEVKAVKQNPHGYDKAIRFVNKAENGKFQVDFDVSDSNSEGFYGLYYGTPMSRLGLTVRSRMFDDLTSLGRDLGNFYEENINGTAYLQKHVQDSDVEKDVLTEYGNSACICQLVCQSKERDLLRKVMFSKNFRSALLEKTRLETLGLVLYLIQQCRELGLDFTGNTFRDVVYFGQTTNGQSVFDLDLKGFQEIASRWRLFQLHEYLTYALESLLHALLCELKRKDEGLSPDDFLKLINGPSDLVAEKLKISVPSNVEGLVGSVLGNFGLKELGQESSVNFSKGCNLQAVVSEKSLFAALQEANKRNDLQQIVANSLSILMLNYIRAFCLLSNVDPVTLWFNNRAIVEWSPAFFAQEIKSKTAKWSVDSLVRYYFKSIIERHDLIAYEKLLSGNDTFRFEEKAGRLKFKMDIYPNYPTQRSSRISSVISILEQLGLIEVESGIKRLTADGELFLGECLNEGSN